MVNTLKQHIHSRVVTIGLIDKSAIEEDQVIPNDFVLFQPYISDEGEDGKVYSYGNDYDFTKRNGNPNLKLHGQHIYNAIQWLKGGGSVLGLRVTADNAKPAFGVLNIRTKPTTVELACNSDGSEWIQEATPNTPPAITRTVPALKISPCFMPVPVSFLTPITLSLSQSLLMKEISGKMQSLPPSTPGWKDHYLTVFKVKGKGKYGNSFGISFALDTTHEEDLEDGRRYWYSVFRKDGWGNLETVAKATSVSFNPTAVDFTETLSEFIDSVILTNQYKKKFDSLAVYTDDDVFDELIAEFTPYCNQLIAENAGDIIYDPETGDPQLDSAGDPIREDVEICKEEDPYFVDFVSLIDRKNHAYRRFVPADLVDRIAFEDGGFPEDVDLVGVNAFLMGGDDGDLDVNRYIIGQAPPGYTGPTPSNPNRYFDTRKLAAAALEQARMKLYARAYSGDIDANILSEYKYKINAIIDANNTMDVKKEMLYFARKRMDIFPYFDAGFIGSAEAALNYRKTAFSAFNNEYGAIFPISGVAYDEYNKRDIDVTYMYEVAYLIPYLHFNEGINRLMAGTRKGRMRTMKSINWEPDEDEKTDFVRNQLNYVEEVHLDEFSIASNRTTYQKRRSFLAIIRNMEVICEVFYIARQILTDLRFEEDAKEAMIKATEQIQMFTRKYISEGPAVRITPVCSQTQSEMYDREVMADIEISFKEHVETFKLQVTAAR
jgi:hypothetical protein